MKKYLNRRMRQRQCSCVNSRRSRSWAGKCDRAASEPTNQSHYPIENQVRTELELILRIILHSNIIHTSQHYQHFTYSTRGLSCAYALKHPFKTPQGRRSYFVIISPENPLVFHTALAQDDLLSSYTALKKKQATLKGRPTPANRERCQSS